MMNFTLLILPEECAGGEHGPLLRSRYRTFLDHLRLGNQPGVLFSEPGGGGQGSGFGGGSGGGTPAPAVAGSAVGPNAAAAGGGGGQLIWPWLFPTSDFINVDKYGAVALPAIGATSKILTFKVPNGRNGKITGLGIDFQPNGALAPNLFLQDVIPFQLTFSLTADGVPFQDFGAFNYLPGSVSSPMGFAGLMLLEGQTIVLNVTNSSLGVTAQFIGGHVQGYYYSSKHSPSDLGYQ